MFKKRKLIGSCRRTWENVCLAADNIDLNLSDDFYDGNFVSRRFCTIKSRREARVCVLVAIYLLQFASHSRSFVKPPENTTEKHCLTNRNSPLSQLHSGKPLEPSLLFPIICFVFPCSASHFSGQRLFNCLQPIKLLASELTGRNQSPEPVRENRSIVIREKRYNCAQFITFHFWQQRPKASDLRHKIDHFRLRLTRRKSFWGFPRQQASMAHARRNFNTISDLGNWIFRNVKLKYEVAFAPMCLLYLERQTYRKIHFPRFSFFSSSNRNFPIRRLDECSSTTKMYLNAHKLREEGSVID